MKQRKRFRLSVLEIVLFSMLGTLMFVLQLVMELLPNIHFGAMLIITYTGVFRKKALFPIYVYVFLVGIRWGFSLSWLPYLYLWTLLWLAVMLLPPRLSPKLGMIVYPTVGFLHGALYGVLYAPAQALLFGLNFRQTLLWIAGGFWFDVLHSLGNLAACTLVVPLAAILKRLARTWRLHLPSEKE